MSSLVDIISSVFPQKRIAIAGDLVADQFLSGTISRVSREAPVFILRHEQTETRPGGAANAAANIAALGATPLVVGTVGDDENGRLLCKSLESAGVLTDQIVTAPGRITTTKVRVLAGQSYSVKQQVIRIDHEDNAELSTEVSARLVESLRFCGETADAIGISDYGYGVVTHDLYQAAADISQSKKIPLIVDSRFRLRDFPGATSATPNQDEVEQLIGRNFTDEDCASLCRDLGLSSMIVTCGNKGMIVVEADRPVSRIPAIGSTEPVDVTGAGDTVIAAFSLGVACGLSAADAADVANHAGGIVVMKKGTATAAVDELIASLSDLGSTATSGSAVK
jgi:rfaE bifunctional protein kinase chain/domain